MPKVFSPNRFVRLPRPSPHPTSKVAETCEPISRCSPKTVSDIFIKSLPQRVSPVSQAIIAPHIKEGRSSCSRFSVLFILKPFDFDLTLCLATNSER